MKSVLVTLLAAVTLVAACSTGTISSPTPGAAVNVVTTTTVFADLVRQVGGADVAVHSLVPNGGDVHTFDPKPSDATSLATAHVVFMNGLGLDDWLTNLVQSAGRPDLPIVKLGENLPDVSYIASDQGGVNPHVWMNVAYAREYVTRIRDELDTINPAHKGDYDANAQAYNATLATLDDYVRSQFAAIPADSRKLVSFHDAFPYYARAYGLTIVGVVVNAPGQDPSASDIANLISAIRAANVRLILSEVQFPDTLVQQIASETGAKVESDLADDALTDTITSYEQLIRSDTDKIVEGLR